MDNTSSKKASHYLKTDDRDWQFILTKVMTLKKWDDRLSAYLEPRIKKYCQVANVGGNRLVIITANGGIAMELRFQTTDLLRKFKQDPLLKTIQEIHCKVHPSFAEPLAKSSPFKKMQALSTKTAEVVREMAASLEDAALREIMERIAGRKG